MSSTNRDGKRVAYDFYTTPSWCVESVYKALDLPVPTLDPCAGDGGILRPLGSPTRGIELQEHLALEARAAGLDVTTGDGLSESWAREHIIMNPPYKDAMAWVEKAVIEAHSALVLLRLSFLASRKRKTFFLKNPPNALAICSKRPSFINGGTDSADYAWFFWDRNILSLSGLSPTEIVWIG